MLNFRFLHNNTYKKLRPSSSLRIGVYRRSGELDYVDWLGVIERIHAINLGGKCVSVKLAIDSFAKGESEFGLKWTDLDDHCFIQGCYIPSLNGVFAVVEEGEPKIVQQQYSMAGAHKGKY
jgi:hypothetical protein